MRVHERQRAAVGDAGTSGRQRQQAAGGEARGMLQETSAGGTAKVIHRIKVRQ
jgi:hypothetical protein